MSVARRLSKGFTGFLWVLVGLSAAGCESYRELFPWPADAGDASVPGTPRDISWGEWAATLNVPACPTDGGVLVVTTADDDLLDGGLAPSVLPDAGARLTFREAVRIAERHPGAETILFDEAVFPADAPTTIHLAPQNFPIAPSAMCIDGRNRGVVIDFGPGLGVEVGPMLRTGPGSLVIGLTFLNLPFEFEFGDTQLAGCRIATDGHALFVRDLGRFWQVEGYNGSRIGPGNVIAGDLFGVRHISSDVTIDGNWFGVDVLTRKLVGGGTGIDLGSMGVREDNLIADNVFATPTAIRASYGKAIIRDNLVGIDRDGYRFPQTSITMGEFSDFGGIGAPGSYVIGPGNVIRGAAVGLTIRGVPAVVVTRNSISEGGVPLSWPAKLFEAPSLTMVSTTSVSGTCPVDGTVELFSGSGSGPERFLADGVCTGGVFTIPISEEPGRFVSATLTDAAAHTSEYSAQLAVP